MLKLPMAMIGGLWLIYLEGCNFSVAVGADLRIRPVMMTVAIIIIGLLPILYGTGTGSEVMSRITAILTLFVLPTFYNLVKREEVNRFNRQFVI